MDIGAKNDPGYINDPPSPFELVIKFMEKYSVDAFLFMFSKNPSSKIRWMVL